MMRLPDHWTWDFWLADTGSEFHLFFLRASRALHDPERRHRRASVGHAVSTDLREWRVVSDALVASDAPAFDDLATWTGSVVRDPAGGWRMFYTGVSRATDCSVQRVGVATSEDLMVWHKDPANPIVVADARWYATTHAGQAEEAWRDPWVYADPDGDGWHMLVTADSATAPPRARAIVGHARSADLRTWEVQPPLSEPDGFGMVEVLQFHQVDGRGVVLFSCLRPELSDVRAANGTTGGIWAVPCDDPRKGIDIGAATLLTDDRLYAGRLVKDRSGQSVLLGFHHTGDDGEFVGGLSDPIPVGWDEHGRLRTLGERLDTRTQR